MSYLSMASLKDKYDISQSTAKRICRFMRESPNYIYKRDYIFIGGCKRYDEDSFIKASNERRIV